jgi:hypothetical protein
LAQALASTTGAGCSTGLTGAGSTACRLAGHLRGLLLLKMGFHLFMVLLNLGFDFLVMLFYLILYFFMIFGRTFFELANLLA